VVRVQRHEAVFTELGASDQQLPTVGGVQVVGVQRDRFTDADAAGSKQSDQGLVSGGPERRSQCTGGGEQGADFGVGVQVRGDPVVSVL
jgi:hypothetical protein